MITTTLGHPHQLSQVKLIRWFKSTWTPDFSLYQSGIMKFHTYSINKPRSIVQLIVQTSLCIGEK
nr:MAG TPA: hypothetical protein [Bacteriophage sp.]